MKTKKVSTEKIKGNTEEELSTRKSILKAATHLFAERGFRGVSVKEIAEAAGANIALISYYFRSKKGLYDSIFQSSLQEIMMNLELSLVKVKADARERLENVLHFFIEALGENTDLARLAAREVYGFGEYTGEQFIETFAAVLSPLEEIISQGIREGIFVKCDPKLAAASILTLLHFFSTSNFTKISGITPKNLIQFFQDNIMSIRRKQVEST